MCGVQWNLSPAGPAVLSFVERLSSFSEVIFYGDFIPESARVYKLHRKSPLKEDNLSTKDKTAGRSTRTCWEVVLFFVGCFTVPLWDFIFLPHFFPFSFLLSVLSFKLIPPLQCSGIFLVIIVVQLISQVQILCSFTRAVFSHRAWTV